MGLASNCKGNSWGFGNTVFLGHVKCECLLCEKSLRDTIMICTLLCLQFIHQMKMYV